MLSKLRGIFKVRSCQVTQLNSCQPPRRRLYYVIYLHTPDQVCLPQLNKSQRRSESRKPGAVRIQPVFRSAQYYSAVSSKSSSWQAKVHRCCMGTLRSSLLPDKTDFTRILPTLLRLLDHFVALFRRLQSCWVAKL